MASDGPYAEVKEVLAGFGIIEVASHDRAVELAGRFAALVQTRVELRPVMDQAALTSDHHRRWISVRTSRVCWASSRHRPSPCCAVALSQVHGPVAALELLETAAADPRLAGHHRVHAVRGHLLRAAGRPDEAAEEYRTAVRRTLSTPERQYLLRQAALVHPAG